MLTLRQIEIIRAIMVTGTVGGAARLLNVSSPGVSRAMKHAEVSVGVKLFSRKGGRYSPTTEANAIFSQINGVYDKVEDLPPSRSARCRASPPSWYRKRSPTCAAFIQVC